MIFSRDTFEGYVRIDNRESPGFTEADGMRNSLLPFVGKGQMFEGSTNTCSHCDRVVVRNPDRTRPRGHCPSCDYFICDGCTATYHMTGDCRCRNKRTEEFFRGVLNGT